MLFVREMNEREQEIYELAISYISLRTSELLDELDNVTEYFNEKKEIDYKMCSDFYFLFHLDEIKSEEEKFTYLIKIANKLQKMKACGTVKVKVATPLHPICWLGYFIKSLKGFFGFCVPFYPNKPILLNHTVFDMEQREFNLILSHELTHSLMNTKDLLAENSKDAINDAWTWCNLF